MYWYLLQMPELTELTKITIIRLPMFHAFIAFGEALNVTWAGQVRIDQILKPFESKHHVQFVDHAVTAPHSITSTVRA